MAQVSLYIDQEVLIKIKKAAKNEKISVSQWVTKKLKSSLNDSLDEDFFRLFGSINDETFRRPKQGKFAQDSKRETF